jgi:lipid-A-disaccharide synthase
MKEPRDMPARGWKVMLVAGDPSGDAHASRVVAWLRRLAPRVRVFGMGGPRLAEAGMDVREDLTQEALVGFVEVLRHLPTVLRRFRQCEGWLDRERPDLLVLVDYPGFNLRLAEKAARRGIPVCYYIAPQAWAWHRERVEAMRRDLKKLLVIFPFEEGFFRREGIDTAYVGHPLTETLAGRRRSPAAVRKALGLPAGAFPVVSLLPGSRRSELRRIWPILLRSVRALTARYPDAVFLVPRPASLAPEDYPGLQPDDPVRFLEGPAWEARSASDLAWVKSGTSTVETALLGVPQVVLYKVAPLSAALARRFVKLRHVGMVNLLVDRPCVPELLQESLTPHALIRESEGLLGTSAARRGQAAQYARIRRDLSRPARPAQTAARHILKMLEGAVGLRGKR